MVYTNGITVPSLKTSDGKVTWDYKNEEQQQQNGSESKSDISGSSSTSTDYKYIPAMFDSGTYDMSFPQPFLDLLNETYPYDGDEWHSYNKETMSFDFNTLSGDVHTITMPLDQVLRQKQLTDTDLW